VIRAGKDAMKAFKRITRIPLIHMLILGGLLFGVFLLLKENETDSENIIMVHNNDVIQLIGRWNAQFKRDPTEQELISLINNHIREEVLYREAKALGLDQDDVVIRRRLTQKIEFLFEDLFSNVRPTEEEIDAYFQKNKANYQIPALVSFSHIYFSTEVRTPEEARVLAGQTREKLNMPAQTSVQAAEQGDYIMLPFDFKDLTKDEVANLFGKTAFTDSVFSGETGTWLGPELSAYGLHLYKVQHRSDKREPELAEVREQVLNDLVRKRREEANELLFEEIRGQYVIEYEDDVEAILNTGTTDQNR
jgi:parvulin-like peptidyl-prolyl isomerase